MASTESDAAPTHSDDFDTAWSGVRHQVLGFCHRSLSDPRDAEDVVQQVAIRAWRGYATFRGDCSFVSWVMTIARRELARAIRGPITRSRAALPIDEVAESTPQALPATPAPGLPAEDPGWAGRVIEAAVAARVIPVQEAQVVLARLACPTCSWDQIGAVLAVAGNTCAQRHVRAIPKLRVFLFLSRPDLLGSRQEIRTAFEVAQNGPDPLTSFEAEIFDRIVLGGKIAYHPRGWKNALRSACDKVIRPLARL